MHFDLFPILPLFTILRYACISFVFAEQKFYGGIEQLEEIDEHPTLIISHKKVTVTAEKCLGNYSVFSSHMH